MYTFITLFGWMLLCLVWFWIATKREWEAGAPISLIFAACIALAMIIAALEMPIGKNNDQEFIAKIEAIRQTVKDQRVDSLSVYERVQLANTIMQYNAELASKKYNVTNPWVNCWYSKDLLKVQPIK